MWAKCSTTHRFIGFSVLVQLCICTSMDLTWNYAVEPHWSMQILTTPFIFFRSLFTLVDRPTSRNLRYRLMEWIFARMVPPKTTEIFAIAFLVFNLCHGPSQEETLECLECSLNTRMNFSKKCSEHYMRTLNFIWPSIRRINGKFSYLFIVANKYDIKLIYSRISNLWATFKIVTYMYIIRFWMRA